MEHFSPVLPTFEVSRFFMALQLPLLDCAGGGVFFPFLCPSATTGFPAGTVLGLFLVGCGFLFLSVDPFSVFTVGSFFQLILGQGVFILFLPV